MIQPAKLLRTALVTAVLSTVCVVSASAASVGVGTVNTDALRLRDEASTSATVLGTASKGDTVVVLEDAGNGWYKVDYKSVEGYMSGEYLNVSAKADVTIGYGLVQSQGSPLNVRSGPGTSYGKVTSLNNGAVVNIVGIDNGWYKISTNGVTGYVSSDYMVTCKDSAGLSCVFARVRILMFRPAVFAKTQLLQVSEQTRRKNHEKDFGCSCRSRRFYRLCSGC